MKRLFSIMLAMVVTLLCSLSVSATDIGWGNMDSNIGGTAEPNWDYTNSAKAMISVSGNDVTGTSVIRANSSVTKITITTELQLKEGNSWRSIDGRGTTVFSRDGSFTHTFKDVSDGKYRIKTIGRVYVGDNYETVYAYSTEMTV